MVNLKSAVTVVFLFIGIAIIAGQALNLFSITAANQGTDRIRDDVATQPYLGSAEQNATNETLNKDSMPPMRNHTRFELEQLDQVYGQERMEKLQESLSRQGKVVRDSYVIEVVSPEQSGKPATASKSTEAIQAATAARNSVKQSVRNIASSDSWYGFGQDDPSAQITNEYQNTINGLTVKNMTKDEIDEVSRLDTVEDIHPNYRFYPSLDESVPHIGAPNVWDGKSKGMNSKVEAVNQTYRTANDMGGNKIRGGDQTIAVIDTGVDYTHPALGGCTRQEYRTGDCDKVRGGYDLADNDSDPMDNLGHGTHVASTIAGTTYPRGVAPNATIYAYKVFSEDSPGATTEDILAAIEQALEDDVDVISMSLGANIPPGNILDRAVNNAVRRGIPVVVAAGNSGFLIGHDSIGSPATAKKSIAVGAYMLNDQPTFFTSRGPVELGSNFSKSYRLKPDVAAPGENICAAKATGTEGKTCIDDRHVSLSGTSMAAPHVSGLVALMKQKHPEWNATTIKNQLEASSQPVDRPYFGGSGRINASTTVSTKRSNLRAMIDSTTKTGTTPLETVLTCTSNLQEAKKTLWPGQGRTRVANTDDIVRQYTYNQTKTHQPTCTVRHGNSTDTEKVSISVIEKPTAIKLPVDKFRDQGLENAYAPEIATRGSDVYVAFDMINLSDGRAQNTYPVFAKSENRGERWSQPEIAKRTQLTEGKIDPSVLANENEIRIVPLRYPTQFVSADDGRTWEAEDTGIVGSRDDPSFMNDQYTGRVVQEGNMVYAATAANGWEKEEITQLDPPTKNPRVTRIDSLDAEIRGKTLHIATLTDRKSLHNGSLTLIKKNLETGKTTTEVLCDEKQEIDQPDLEVDGDVQVAGFNGDYLKVFDKTNPCGRPVTEFYGGFDYEVRGDTDLLVLWDHRREGLLGGDVTYYVTENDGLTWSDKRIIRGNSASSWAPRATSGPDEFHIVWQEADGTDDNWDVFYSNLSFRTRSQSCSATFKEGITENRGAECGDKSYNATFDINEDGEIDVQDVLPIGNKVDNRTWCRRRIQNPPEICNN